MRGSKIARYIERDYRIKKAYENKYKRINCKDKSCEKCKFEKVCEDK